MEERLALRLRMFREGGQAEPRVTDFVAGELDALAADGHVVTEDTAGMLASHLVMALTRLLDGEAIEQFLTDEQVAAELAQHPEAVATARAVAARAETALGAALPESEINFLGMHLAALAQHSRT
ncbi:PRD domain-containing protein [Streptomyces sp. DSM 41972]|uniref:PRD domain-containing protein n=1 Tax=Streptomyces althioticus subsp. attaecolombicae TaxID=3075534 RepID=A0ABU3I3T7_9ACTN|nr:PRD domain-containing protein [Streptomyces sp. DSM 41972]SCD41161.1 PRD domain-containing protein [Streptomyces sp. di188]SCD48661.1 PRD domain-containing protein [Streptomyces sp. di50b]